MIPRNNRIILTYFTIFLKHTTTPIRFREVSRTYYIPSNKKKNSLLSVSAEYPLSTNNSHEKQKKFQSLSRSLFIKKKVSLDYALQYSTDTTLFHPFSLSINRTGQIHISPRSFSHSLSLPKEKYVSEAQAQPSGPESPAGLYRALRDIARQSSAVARSKRRIYIYPRRACKHTWTRV